jgi:hypothetical protein
MVREIQIEIRDKELHPGRAAELLARLTALLGNTLEEIRAAEYHYSVVLLKYLDSDEAANRAKIRAETTPEFMRKREARDTKELVVQLIGGLKYMLRTQAEEMRLTR